MANEQRGQKLVPSSPDELRISIHTWESRKNSRDSNRQSRNSQTSSQSKMSESPHKLSGPPSPIQEVQEMETLKTSLYAPKRNPSTGSNGSVDPRVCYDQRARFETNRVYSIGSGYSEPEEEPAPLRVPIKPLHHRALKKRGLPTHSPVSPPSSDAPVQVNVTEPSPTTARYHHQNLSEETLPPVPPIPPQDQLPQPKKYHKPNYADAPPSSALHAIRAMEKELLQDRQSKTSLPSLNSLESEGSALPQVQHVHAHRNDIRLFEKELPPLPVEETWDKPRRVSRGRSRTPRSLKRMSVISATPSDLIRPPSTFIRDSGNRAYFTERTLGQTSGPRPTSRPPDEENQEPPPSPTPSGAPDGGWLAWMLAVCGLLSTFCTWGLAWSYGIFAAYYKTVMLPDESLSRISWIGSVQLCLLFFLGQPVGLLMDKGYFRPFSIGGAILLVLGIFATSWCTEWWHFFLAQGLLTGSGMGLVFSSGVLCLMEWFERNLGKAMALAATGSCFGAIVYTLIFIHVVTAKGFPWTMRVIGFVTLVLIIPSSILLRQRHSTNKSDEKQKKKMKLTWAVFTDPPYLVMTAGFFFAFWSLYFAITYIVLFSMQVLHLPGTTAANVLIAMSACNLLGRLLPGIVSDTCTGPLNLVIPSCILSAAFSVVWIWSTSEGSLFAVACFYGFSSGGIQALFSPAMHSFSMDDHENMGAKGGLFLTSVSFGALTGNPLGGALVGDKGEKGYLGAQLFAGGSMLVAAVLLLVARWMRVGWEAKRA